MEQEIGFREKLLGQFQKWSDELADLSGRNLLIAFKSTKRSTLHLAEDHVGLAQLYRGDDVCPEKREREPCDRKIFDPD